MTYVSHNKAKYFCSERKSNLKRSFSENTKNEMQDKIKNFSITEATVVTHFATRGSVCTAYSKDNRPVGVAACALARRGRFRLPTWLAAPGPQTVCRCSVGLHQPKIRPVPGRQDKGGVGRIAPRQYRAETEDNKTKREKGEQI